eukprot:gene7504-8299_t
MGKKSNKSKSKTDSADTVKPKTVDQEKLKDIDDLFSSLKEKKKHDLSSSSHHEVNDIDKTDVNPKKKRKLRVSAAADDEAQGALKEEEEEEFHGPYGVIRSSLRHSEIPVSIISPEAPLERIDAESGLPVYKAHILKVGEGGGTPLCPFDCDCCF